MSRDKSLKSKSSLARHRNVLTRAERVSRLQEVGRWSDEATAIGLPKVAHRKAAVGKKDKAAKKQEDGAEGAAATAKGAKGAMPEAKTASTGGKK